MSDPLPIHPGETPASADVIVIGGGPAGAGVLWALHRAAPELRAVLIERRLGLASGSSTASLEAFRTAWPALCQAELMRRSVDVFMNAEHELGAPIGTKVRGYLWCAFTDQQAETMRREVDHLHAIGLTHIEYLDHEEVVYRFPWLGDAVTAAKYDPHAGWLDSNALVYALARSAPNARLILGAHDVRITSSGGRVTGVTIDSGHIASPIVVIAAGAYSRAVGRTAGIELPLVMRPRQSFTTGWRHAAFPADAPMVIGMGPHVRPEAQNGAIFGWEYDWNTKYVLPDQPVMPFLIDPIEPVDRCKDPRFPSVVLALIARQFKHKPGEGFASAGYLRGLEHHAGYYVSRAPSHAYRLGANGDHYPLNSQRPILDRWPELDGLILSVAHVGHGVMSAPGAGEIVADLILNRPFAHPSYADFTLAAHDVPFDSGGIGEANLLEN